MIDVLTSQRTDYEDCPQALHTGTSICRLVDPLYQYVSSDLTPSRSDTRPFMKLDSV